MFILLLRWCLCGVVLMFFWSFFGWCDELGGVDVVVFVCLWVGASPCKVVKCISSCRKCLPWRYHTGFSFCQSITTICHFITNTSTTYEPLNTRVAWGPDSDPDYVDCSSEFLICSTKAKLYAPSCITQNPGDEPGEVFARWRPLMRTHMVWRRMATMPWDHDPLEGAHRWSRCFSWLYYTALICWLEPNKHKNCFPPMWFIHFDLRSSVRLVEVGILVVLPCSAS